MRRFFRNNTLASSVDRRRATHARTRSRWPDGRGEQLLCQLANQCTVDDDPRSPFLHPKEVQPVELEDHYSDENKYIESVGINILAEFWAMFTQRSKRWPGWRAKTLQMYTIETCMDEGMRICRLALASDSDENVIKELDRNLCVWCGTLYLTTYDHKQRILRMIPGSGLLELGFPDHQDPEEAGELYSYGYIGDMLREYSTCHGFLSGAVPKSSIVSALASPRSRHTSSYPQWPLSESVPINGKQLSTLRSLQFEVEAIQGPPGTGKSTTIFHIINSFSDPDDCILATCVQNKAVDAIAEKMCLSAAQVPFFVIGHEDRVGQTAAQWTIDAQVSRSPKVINLESRRKRVSDLVKRMEDFVCQKMSIFTEGRRLKRFEQYRSLLKRVPATARAREEFELLWQQKRDGWAMFWKLYVRKKYQIVLAVCKAAQEEEVLIRTELVKVRLEERHHIINASRAILCTVQTASTSAFHSEDLAGFREKIKTVVLDEAGTVPESKVPLILALNPVRIVAIGDHKQLAPFTYIQNSRPIGFFHRIESALPAGSIHALTTQYRMGALI